MAIKQGNIPCPCGSGQSLMQCCGKYIYTNEKAPNAETLMRSRYTANVKKAYKYLAQTWHDSTRPSKLSSGKIQWLSLKVIDVQTEGSRAWVEFKAYCQQHDHKHLLHEKSFFVKEPDWLYVDGEILSHCQHHD